MSYIQGTHGWAESSPGPPEAHRPLSLRQHGEDQRWLSTPVWSQTAWKETCSPGQERAKWGRRVSQPLVKRHFYPSLSESFWGCFSKIKKREESLRTQVMSKFHFRNIRNKQASFLKFSYCYNGVKKKSWGSCGPQDFGWLVNACMPPSTPFKHHTKQTLLPHSQIHANTHSSNLL